MKTRRLLIFRQNNNGAISTWRVFFWTIWLALVPRTDAYTEADLYTAIFTGYNPEVRPVNNASTLITVQMHLTINSLIDVNEVDQVMTTNAIVLAKWTDEILTWDPAAYDDVDRIVVSPTSVWTPDFVLENSATSFYDESFRRDFRPDILADGSVIWAFGGNLKTTCDYDMTYFPFDLQTCSLIFDNWAYLGNAVQLTNDTDGLDFVKAVNSNGIWTIEGGGFEVGFYSLGDLPDVMFSRITFDLKLARKSRYYVLNLLVPAAFLVLMTLAEFWLPADSGEKVSLGITVLLSFSVLLLVINDSTPKNSDHSPILSIFFIIIMALAALSIMVAVLVLRCHHKRGTKRAPRWVRFLCFRIGMRVLCFRNRIPVVEGFGGKNEVEDYPTGLRSSPRRVKEEEEEIKVVLPPKLIQDKELKEILALLQGFKDDKEENDQEEKYQHEYVLIGCVIDRLFFWISLLSFVITCAVIFTSFPTSHD